MCSMSSSLPLRQRLHVSDPRSRLQVLYKVRRSPWKETLRQRRLERLKSAREAQVDIRRNAVMERARFEGDLEWEQELRQEQAEREFEVFDELFLPVTHACPVCCAQMQVHTFGTKLIACESCGIRSSMSWREFQQELQRVHSLHVARGCVLSPEFLFFEQNLFLACDSCDFLDVAAV